MRWWYYTVEPGWNGTHGPWGPISADSEAQALDRARARSAYAGRTVSRVEQASAS